MLELRCINPLTRQVNRSFWPVESTPYAALTSLVGTPASPANVFFGVLPRAVETGTSAVIEHGACVWVDIDFKDTPAESALNVIGCFPHHPTAIVHSGHGLHCYWALNQSIPTAEIESINRELIAVFGGDRGCWDHTRILRLPGTINWKDPLRPTHVTLLQLTGARHDPEEFERYEEEILPLRFSTGPSERLSPLWERYVEQGISADVRGFYQGDRSRLDMAVIREMVRCDWTNDEILAAFTDPTNGISEKTLERSPRSQERYVLNAAEKARDLR